MELTPSEGWEEFIPLQVTPLFLLCNVSTSLLYVRIQLAYRLLSKVLNSCRYHCN